MSEFVEVKTAELNGAALDWAVAQVEREAVDIMPCTILRNTPRLFVETTAGAQEFTPSANWSQAGPLMEKYCKGFGMLQDGTDSRWRAFAYNPDSGMQRMVGGESILVAFCRALVALKSGETVSVPAELLPC